MRPRIPPPVTALAAVALFVLAAPVVALGARVPWSDLGSIARSPDTLEMLGVTLASASLASLITLIIGAPLAVWTSSLKRGSHLARIIVLLPLALPPVVAGLALSALLGRRGVAAPLLDALGIQFAFAFPGVVASHVFVALPFAVITLDSALRQFDRRVIASAAAVGISPARILTRILAPAMAPSMVAAAGLAFARSLGEFGTTLTFAGSLPGTTRTVSVGIYLAREIDPATAYGLAALLALIAATVLAAASLPMVLRRAPREEVRSLAPVDRSRLAELTRPSIIGREVTARGAVFPAAGFTALVGPNGCGKSTLLREMSRGGGAVLLTQNPALPPTSTPLGCVAMVTRDEARARALLTAAGLASLADVPVPSLSGGQAAQVSLVRALAARPSALLLDEPLAALDVASAQSWRALLTAACERRTTVMATHDLIDVATLSDHVAVMQHGGIVALRSTSEELASPSTAFAARLAGLNWLPASTLDVAGDGESDAIAVFPRSAVRLGEDEPLFAEVLSLTATAGGDVYVELEAGDGVLVATLPRAQAVTLRPGQGVHVGIDPDALSVRGAERGGADAH